MNTFNVSDFTAWMHRHPLGQQFARDVEDDWLVGRRKLVEEIEAEKAAHKKRMVTLQKDVETTAAKEREAYAAWVAAKTAHSAALLARTSENSVSQAFILQRQSSLQSTADTRIIEFASELGAMYQTDRHMSIAREQMKFLRKDGNYGWEEHTAGPNVKRHLAAIRAAIDEVRGWVFEALSSDELTSRIAAVRSRLQQTRQQAKEIEMPTEAA